MRGGRRKCRPACSGRLQTLREHVRVRGPGDDAAAASPMTEQPQPASSADADRTAVAALLGREPAGAFEVLVRDANGVPIVIRNEPFLADGTPMPTTYWLVGRREREAVARLESTGGIRDAEAAVPPDEVARAHTRYAAERDARVPADHSGPRPSGGVGGTRVGVKCLHAHLAAYLAGSGDPVGRYVATRLAREIGGSVAAVDCGTNSTRLLVLAAGGEPIERLMRITRLGAGVDRTGSLDPAAIERTLEVLGEYRAVMDGRGVVRVRAAATSAARDATNADELLEPALAVLGVPLELLAGPEEGQLSYAGATTDLPLHDGPYLVVDLGGGSTELVAGRASTGAPVVSPGSPVEPAAVVSLDVGCVRVAERFLKSDPPSAAELGAARALARGLLDEAIARLPALLVPRRMVGLAGTVSAAAAMALELDSHDATRTHHHVLERAVVERLLQRLSALDVASRRQVRGLEPARADVIVGGLVVLGEVMDRLGHDRLVVSERDILDGMAASLTTRP